MTTPFIKGLDLAEAFYAQAVRPILEQRFPDVIHSAALIGAGSEVLGFDTPQSRDHDWGPRATLFLSERDHREHKMAIDQALRSDLPAVFHGYSTHFTRSEQGTTWMVPFEGGQLNHRVSLVTVEGFFRAALHFDPRQALTPIDWLTTPSNQLAMLTAGRVFHDGLGQLEPVRRKLAYYPGPIWLYLLAAQWRRIAQEEAFMGRCGQVADELGSRLVAGRLVKDIMRLSFLMARRYAPYIKWFGTAFAQLDCAPALQPILTRVLEADSWQMRQTHLTTAYEYMARWHNKLAITPPVPSRGSPFYDRPFLVIQADRFADAIRAQITDEEVLALPVHLGAVDQFMDSTDGINHVERFRSVYGS